MKSLADVTLIGIAGVPEHVAPCQRAMARSMRQVEFGEAFLLTEPRTYQEHNRFILHGLHREFTTSHCLVIHADSWVLNGDAWDDRWLEFDWVGAPWYDCAFCPDGTVGNGGFCLRSRRLLSRLSKMSLPDSFNEDTLASITWRDWLEYEGFRWAGEESAARFSFETRFRESTFGFHGNRLLESSSLISENP